MRIAATLLISIFTVSLAMAQTEGMARLGILSGNWKGTANVSKGPQNQETMAQYESVNFKLGGTVMLIEGTGVSQSDTAFQALAVISYDNAKKEYSMRSYLADGKITDAWFKFTGESTIEWGFSVPTGKIKYVINIIDGNKWVEKGYFSPSPDQSFPFFSMELEKV